MKAHDKWLAVPLAVGLAAAALGGCDTEGAAGAGGSGTIVVGMSDRVAATDPAAGYDPGSWLLFNNVFQSLLSFPKGATTPQPEAAERCGFDKGDSAVYQCTLREGLKFSNGNPLTSEDVRFSFERALKIDDENGPAPLLSTIGRIETPDDRTVVFVLKVPDATFPSKIASAAGSIVDHREYRADSLRTDGKAVGSGPYRLDSFDEGRAVFSVNPGYRGSAKIKNGGVTLRFYDGDRKALAEGLAKGDVDVAYRGLAAEDIRKYDGSTTAGREDVQDIEVVEGSSAEVQYLVFNMKDPVAGRLGVRRAIAHLVDRQALVRDVYHSTATPLYSIVPAGILGHNTAFFDRYGDRPQIGLARKALRAEGIEGKVEITLHSTPSRYGPGTDEQIKAIAGQLNRSGLFEARVKSVEYGRYEKDVQAGRYGVYVKGWIPDYPDPDNFTQPFFGEDNVLGNHYENAEITGRIIPDTAATADRSAARDDFDRLQNLVAEDVPLLPLWQAKQYAVARGAISGLEWTLDASTVFRFWEIRKD
ncbi:ABC transporter substrate-binding protein [Streptomyces somaliensis DSM 40738]|uniref:ABC transporter substrate-binding protein n=1 Tax=Streptomyces somaliensis TaxID=78355 RepID=UPI0021C44FB6|nr:ABC transporter substrate-binding protein [Streptomyces somaliensis]MCQ0022078.1 ABC transporter substrate-binding protein [Streptomyces somaliensis DSM 40738]